uniref:Uncharacterized protein n=1 Tax=Amphimedon queenslandica TaxID=400682 RepID=A0A1X7V440_AMPQE
MPKTCRTGRRGRGSGRGVSREGAGPTLASPGRGRPRHGVPLTRADLSPVSAPVVQEPGPSSSALSEFLALIRQEVRQQLAAASPAGIQDHFGAPLVPADPVASPLADSPSGSPAGVLVRRAGSPPVLTPGVAPVFPPGGAPVLPPGGAPVLPPGGAPVLPPGGAPVLPPGGAPVLPHGGALPAPGLPLLQQQRQQMIAS